MMVLCLQELPKTHGQRKLSLRLPARDRYYASLCGRAARPSRRKLRHVGGGHRSPLAGDEVRTAQVERREPRICAAPSKPIQTRLSAPLRVGQPGLGLRLQLHADSDAVSYTIAVWRQRGRDAVATGFASATGRNQPPSAGETGDRRSALAEYGAKSCRTGRVSSSSTTPKPTWSLVRDGAPPSNGGHGVRTSLDADPDLAASVSSLSSLRPLGVTESVVFAGHAT